MALSNDLISQFAKVTKDNSRSDNRNKESIVYGTIVEQDGKFYTRLDGSDLLTPISTTTEFKPGERVTVLLKNHSAVVTGNASSPSARIGTVNEISDTLEVEKARIDDLYVDNATINGKLTSNEADIKDLEAVDVTIKGELEAQEADIKSINAEQVEINGKLTANAADIKDLETDNATINEKLTAQEASIKTLETDNATINEKLTAQEADIESLKTNKLDVETANIKYANIDFSNIGVAAIEKFYSTSGIIKDLVIGDQIISGKLVGVTIAGDLIEGNTVVADKLVIKGEDGLYYKLNTDGISTEAEQTDYNSLNGNVIRAKSVTAEKIAVNDLVAFDATIAGFKITNTSLYSGVKSSIDNKTRGVYLDKDGQVSFGDGHNYLKYYKDADGNYKLVISADSVTFSNGTNAEDAISDLENRMDGLKVIDSTVVTYQAGTSGTTEPTGEWQDSIPVIQSGQYLWTRTVITYVDSTYTTLYSVSSNGQKGEKGDPGEAGPAGSDGSAGIDAITLSITSSNGNIFRNSSGSTTLTAHVYLGGVEQSIASDGTCGSLGFIKWYKGNSSAAVATANSITVSASDVEDSSVYTCQLED